MPSLSVIHVMSTPVLTLHIITDLKTVITYLLETTFSGFPVVTNDEHKSFIGLITREELVGILIDLSHVLQEDEDDALIKEAFERPDMIYRPSMEYSEFYRILFMKSQYPLALVTTLKRQLSYKGRVRNFKLDTSKYINTSALSVKTSFSLYRGYTLMTTLGSRHLTVVNDRNQVEGMITRKDLIGSHMEDRISDNWKHSARLIRQEYSKTFDSFTSSPNPVYKHGTTWEYITTR